MAIVDFDALKASISEEAPCGPDLDMDFDDDYMNFVANLEGLLPTTFFTESGPFTFDPTIIDVVAQRETCLALLQRTRDLRLLVHLARLYILSRDLSNFAQTVDVMASLLEAFWEPVHPSAEGGKYTLRSAILTILDEPTISFSLQYCQLCDTRRQGPVTFRSYLYAIREADPREGEAVSTESFLTQAIRDSGDQIAETRAHIELLLQSFQRISTAWGAHADYVSAPKFTNVTGVASRMLSLIQSATGEGSAAAVEVSAEAGAAPGPVSTKIGSAHEALQALKASIAYFMAREPSSPVLPLMIQAEQLVGKSFPEVLQVLMPDQMSSATFKIGGRQFFELPLERLPNFEMPSPSGDRDDDTPQWDASHQDGEQEVSPPAPEPAPRPAPVATTRQAALGLLDDVATYLRSNEPGSPIPWLIERARALADRDFLSILRAILPERALKDLDQN